MICKNGREYQSHEGVRTIESQTIGETSQSSSRIISKFTPQDTEGRPAHAPLQTTDLSMADST